jgi:hypothetical protein
MRVSPLRWLAVAVVAASLGCVNVSVSRSGDRFDPRPEDCVIDYRYGDVQKAMGLVQSGYVQVGSITVVKGGDTFDDAMKDRVGPKACELGGEIVMMGPSSPGSFDSNYSYASLMVFRKIEQAAPAHSKTTEL